MIRIRNTIILASLLLVANSHFGQTLVDASNLYQKKQYDSALVITKSILEKDSTYPDAFVLAGRILNAKKNYVEATPYLEKALTFYDATNYARAWSMCELGLCYFSVGKYKEAKEKLEYCVEMNATKNSTKAASYLMLKLGFDKIYDSWKIYESEDFIFHFQDSSDYEANKILMNKKREAFRFINNFFKAELPKQVDYFIWSDSKMADSLLRQPLAFTDATLCLTHTGYNHTIGHEMTHSISYHAFPNAKWNRLIAEGICVYFDQSNKKNISTLKSKIKSPISIVDLWKNNSNAAEDILYPIGSEIVKRLIELKGRETFIQFFSDQSYEHAKSIYGTELNSLIAKLEKEINP